MPDLTREQRDAYITSVLSSYHRVEEGHPAPCPECEDIVGMVLMIEAEARAEQAAEVERLRAALEGLVRKMAPHSGSCCTFDDDGTVRVTRQSCKCGPVERAAHEAIDWYGTTWKRGTRPTGSGAALAATPEPRP